MRKVTQTLNHKENSYLFTVVLLKSASIYTQAEHVPTSSMQSANQTDQDDKAGWFAPIMTTEPHAKQSVYNQTQ